MKDRGDAASGSRMGVSGVRHLLTSSFRSVALIVGRSKGGTLFCLGHMVMLTGELLSGRGHRVPPKQWVERLERRHRLEFERNARAVELEAETAGLKTQQDVLLRQNEGLLNQMNQVVGQAHEALRAEGAQAGGEGRAH